MDEQIATVVREQLREHVTEAFFDSQGEIRVECLMCQRAAFLGLLDDLLTGEEDESLLAELKRRAVEQIAVTPEPSQKYSPDTSAGAGDRLFDPGPPVAIRDGQILHQRFMRCRWCGISTRWVWSPVGKVWLCNAYTTPVFGGAPTACGKGQGQTERLATPDEVDAGCELGIAYDPVGGWPPADTQGGAE